jgi:hypothetical protein
MRSITARKRINIVIRNMIDLSLQAPDRIEICGETWYLRDGGDGCGWRCGFRRAMEDGLLTTGRSVKRILNQNGRWLTRTIFE